MTEDLRAFVSSINHGSHLRVETELGDGFVRLRSEEAERRQAAHDIRCVEDAVIEVLRNSRDAGAKHIYVAVSKEENERYLTVIDDGVGIPPYLHDLIFEPRVTSKLDSCHLDKWGVHGRGMALFSIKVNAKLSKVAYSDKGLGCALEFIFATDSLPEKVDQSTFPSFAFNEGGKVKITGPHNILRTVTEFALEERNNLTVYLGSPAEIASSIYNNSLRQIPLKIRAQGMDPHATSLVQWFAYALEPKDFCQYASQLGLYFSERTALRILNNQVTALDPVDHLVYSTLIQSLDQDKRQISIHRNNSRSSKKPVFTSEDVHKITSSFLEIIDSVLPAYYVRSSGDPQLMIRDGKIILSLEIEED